MNQFNYSFDPSPVIQIENLWAGYDHEAVIEDVNLTVYRGDFIGLIGPNGGGKSTLLKVILGIVPPLRGKISILGKSVQEARQHIGYMPQSVENDLVFPVKVWDVVRMGRVGKRGLLRPYTQEDDDIVAEAIRQVDLESMCQKSISELSGGQRQRVYIARALAASPEILLLDEPTASVDMQVSQSIYELLHKLNEKITIVLISHDMTAVSSYVKTIGCINRRLFYHGEKQITPDMLEAAYQCPVDLIAHGLPHRVYQTHQDDEV